MPCVNRLADPEEVGVQTTVSTLTVDYFSLAYLI